MLLKRLLTHLLILIVICADARNKYDFSYLNRRISSWVDSGYYKGSSVVIGQGNKDIYMKCYGNYNLQSTAYVASAGKWIGAAVIAAIVDEGKLSWDDKVKKWLPQFKDIKGEATLRQLFSHTSGFPDYQPKGHHPDNYQTLKQAADSIVGLPADTAPGAVFHYGGLAMQVAGCMAEVATGKDFETLFQEKIAQPLGMTLTHFTPVDETPGHNPMIGGGLKAGLQDFANFLNMILNNGVFRGKRILSENAIREMQADQVGNAFVKDPEFPQLVRTTFPSKYGLGEWREELDTFGNPTILSSPGWVGAYPWIDKKYNVYGFILARINRPKDGFNSFLGSPVLPYIVRDAIDRSQATGVKKGWVDVKDGRLYYEESGKGEPLIFIHGHSLDNTMWDIQFREFAQKYRVIRYDARGYGQSSMPDESKQFMHVEDLIRLMDQLKIKKAHIIGLSMGGFIALDCIALHQDRLLSATLASGNIFSVNGPDTPWTTPEIEKRNKEIAELKSRGIDPFKREWFNALMNSSGSQKERMRAPLWKMIYEWEAWQPLHREPRLVLGNSVIDILKKETIKVPVLILEGKSPNNHYKEHLQVLDLIPSAKLQFIEDAGHMMNMERPEEFNKAVWQFLDNERIR
jgi:Beta-lactamase class C and other penicillin binding proteins